jgi:hypothetical protein
LGPATAIDAARRSTPSWPALKRDGRDAIHIGIASDVGARSLRGRRCADAAALERTIRCRPAIPGIDMVVVIKAMTAMATSD